MHKDTWEMIERLKKAGITEKDAFALRRIAMTLQRWHELECGDEHGLAIEQDEKSGKWKMYRPDQSGKGWTIPDREKGAKKRLGAIMARYPALIAYVQGDPRGPALYILPASYVPKGLSIESYYTHGIAVYK